MKNIAKNLVIIAVAVLAATVVNRNLPRVSAQSAATTSPVAVFPTVALTACAWPADVVSPPPSGYVAYCSTTQGLAYAIGPSTTFTLIASSGGPVLPQSIAPASGTCITGYTASTGVFSTAACLPSITKAQVLATGVAAVTSSNTTSTTTLQ